MNYYELTVELSDFDGWNDIIVAYLADLEFESFHVETPLVKAYIQQDAFDGEALQQLFDGINQEQEQIQSFEIKLIPQQNWNAEWEAQFDPVFIGEDIRVVAPFHDLDDFSGIEIVIEPKMSFGTGHHQTTFLMCEEISSLKLDGKYVLDMGSGTGVLSILAEKCGAKEILAIDIESWSVENCEENTKRNKCSKIISKLGDIIDINGQSFDVIIANINKNVLLSHLPSYSKCINANGILLLSGFFETDAEDLISAAFKENLVLKSKKIKDGWAMLCFLSRES